ncbi:molybdate ABC transporter substrate-binding protein [uncultured Roseivirga sp.]|uniref:molybdate ABC transporter substrate-binding protein n=1 Tax=uncultured Roseivirga sp. TaxID=543088 RepID=UPI000D7A4FC8|nr:molybdate ABC transporter substrate-binding protein [uncultured Roseivirga sp.]PWL31686.1 MAG: molybdate ABC transporter substrate-binding protein [Roseivirga sp. XM-24bin3]
MTKRSVNRHFIPYVIAREVRPWQSPKSESETASCLAVTFGRLFHFFFLALISVSCSPKKSSLTIATAANMQFAMNALVEAYEAETGTQCEIILGSSGKLTAQIQQGAPYDLFFSADTTFPEALQASGNTIGDPVIYAQGQLVLWSMKENLLVSLDQLSSEEVSHIALANPKTAPYGLAAEEVLKRLNLYEASESKFVFGESISQVNQFIISQASEMGFTAKSVVLSPNMSTHDNWITIADSLHSPINQAMVILKNDRGLGKEAESFVAFVRSEKGLSILRNFGYK